MGGDFSGEVSRRAEFGSETHHVTRLEPTWQPAALAEWSAPGGPLDGVGTLGDLCGDTDSTRGPAKGSARSGGSSAPLADLSPPSADPSIISAGISTLSDDDRKLDSEALRREVASTARGLASLGVRAGDVVAWQLPNTVESVVLYRACWSLAAVAAPIHHLAGPSELGRLVGALGPRVLVTTEGARPLDQPDPDQPDPDQPGPDHTGPEATGPGDTGHEAGPDPGGARPVDPSWAMGRDVPAPEDIAVVLHTSGSSGSPKGVLHTHRSLAHKARAMVGVHGLTDADVVLMPAPLAHVSGLLNGILVPSAAEMTTVLMARWSPEAALGLIESEGVTFMVGPPTFFVGLEGAEGFSPSRVASLRLLSVGGAGVSPEFVAYTADLFGAEVKRTYGSTEAPTVTSAGPDDDDWTRAHTDGRPTGPVRIRTVDPGTGRPTGPGTAGEVQLSGPELFCGYTDPDRTAEVTVRDDGDWFRTGDLGVLDGDGRLTITGRIANVIIRGGENIDAAEVEAHLSAHPAVRAAVVVGEPDDRLGERVCAFVQLNVGRDLAPDPAGGADRPGFDITECRSWFEQRGVARFRTPERIVVLEELPLLASGKADRAALTRRARGDH